jgi:hypothetical protein
MNIEDFKSIVKNIVVQADILKHQLVNDLAPVNYACIFCQNDEEYLLFVEMVKQIGKVILDTKAGPVFQIEPLLTIAGDLRILKIRKPDKDRSERGDADFTLSNYDEFKKEHINQKRFKLIDKGNFEMIEYKHPNSDVLVYFSNPTLAEVLKIT